MPQTPVYDPNAAASAGPSEVVGFSLYDEISQQLHAYRFAELSDDEDGWFLLTLGRQGDCVVGNRPASIVSRHHAGLEAIVGEDAVMITDTSLYGTQIRRLDGTLVSLRKDDSADLADGDELFLPSEAKADAVLRFNYIRTVRPALTPALSAQDPGDGPSRPATFAGTPRTPVTASGPVATMRLTCEDGAVAAYVVRPGDTVGIVRRSGAGRPRIELPSRHGFEGVSQIQGRFQTNESGSWEFVHEGSNWTLVRHADGREAVLRQKGAAEAVEAGDAIVFSGSPAFVLGR